MKNPAECLESKIRRSPGALLDKLHSLWELSESFTRCDFVSPAHVFTWITRQSFHFLCVNSILFSLFLSFFPFFTLLMEEQTWIGKPSYWRHQRLYCCCSWLLQPAASLFFSWLQVHKHKLWSSQLCFVELHIRNSYLCGILHAKQVTLFKENREKVILECHGEPKDIL